MIDSEGRLSLSWFAEPALFMLAQSKARDVGDIAIDGRATASSDEQFQSLMDGDVAVAVTSMDNVLDWNLRTDAADFRIIAQVERTTPISLVAQAAFTSIEALRGRSLLVDAPENGFVVALKMLLANAGLSADDYSLAEAGGGRERFELLVGGTGDATLLIAPLDGMAVAAGCRQLASINDHFPAYPGQGLVMRQSAYPAIHPTLSRWLAQLEAARRSALADTAAAATRLQDQDVPAVIASRLVALLPDSLLPRRDGIELLCAHRRDLGLPGGDAAFDAIVDRAPVENIIKTEGALP